VLDALDVLDLPAVADSAPLAPVLVAVQCIASPLLGELDVADEAAALAASTTGRATPTTTLPACDARRPMPSATRCNGGAGIGSGSVSPRRSSTARRTPASSR
jgi:hypothetical protein